MLAKGVVACSQDTLMRPVTMTVNTYIQSSSPTFKLLSILIILNSAGVLRMIPLNDPSGPAFHACLFHRQYQRDDPRPNSASRDLQLSSVASGPTSSEPSADNQLVAMKAQDQART